MKKFFFLLTVVLPWSLVAQVESKPPLTMFAEGGMGYSYNTPTYFYYVSEASILAPNFFSHGINPHIRFGATSNGKFNVGLAARYSLSFHRVNYKWAFAYLDDTYPGLSTISDPFWPFRLSSLQIGPVISVPIRKFTIDAEVAGGYSSIRMPHIFIGGTKPGEQLEYYYYLYRYPQKVRYTVVTPSAGLRYNYMPHIYSFFRFEFSMGFIDGTYNYEAFPSEGSRNTEVQRPVGMDDYQLLNFNVGLGVSVGRK